MTTTPDNLQQNSLTERINSPLIDLLKVILEEAVLISKYTEYEIEHVAYVKNRGTQSSLECSLYEKLTGKKMCLKHSEGSGRAALLYTEAPKT